MKKQTPNDLSFEREVLLADMIETMTYSLRACIPPEAAVVLSNVMANIIHLAVGDDAKQDDAMFQGLEASARRTLAKRRAERKPS